MDRPVRRPRGLAAAPGRRIDRTLAPRRRALATRRPTRLLRQRELGQVAEPRAPLRLDHDRHPELRRRRPLQLSLHLRQEPLGGFPRHFEDQLVVDLDQEPRPSRAQSGPARSIIPFATSAVPAWQMKLNAARAVASNPS